MAIIKNPQMEQQRNIDSANKYIDDTVKAVLGQVHATKDVADRNDGQGRSTPEAKAIALIGARFDAMVNNIKALNNDTTQTADAVTLKQANILDKGIAEAKAMLSEGVTEVNTLTHSAKGKLFSRSVDETPRNLAMLSNPTLLAEIRANYLDFVDSPFSANAVNAFRVYGLLPKTLNDSIARSLDARHSPDAVNAIDALAKQKKNLQHMEKSLTTVHQKLTRDPSKIVGIRARVFE